jgi:nickel transport protein
MTFGLRCWPALVLAVSASAHDLQVSFDRQNTIVIARAAYAGTEPCPYASVLVYAPGETKTEHQNGRTDAQGLFAFVPDRPGIWRFVIDDEMGHRKDMTVDVTAAGGPVTVSAQLPVWQKALTGAALILALTGFLYGWKARRAR